MNIEGASAIVTGGASGLGAATARRLAERNVKVVVVDIQDELGEAIATEINGAYVRADVTSEEEVQAAVDTAMEMAPLRAVVNCAGIGPPQRTINRDGEPHSFDLFKLVVNINMVGTFNVIRLARSEEHTSELQSH